MTIEVKPDILKWVRRRIGLNEAALSKRLGIKADAISKWEETGKLKFSQAEKLAAKTYTPFGYLFLDEPPNESLPITDFRTVADAKIRTPSPELLETVQSMQRRQAWMRQFLISEGESEFGFVGSETVKSDIGKVANEIRSTLQMGVDWARDIPTWSEARVFLRNKIEEVGILIVINGVVGNNTRRPLKLDEFRGFALCDTFAPLIFINGVDGKAAQMFTFAHELAHLWIGSDGVSNFEQLQPVASETERFCNAVAAEFLVPEAAIRYFWSDSKTKDHPFHDLARRFKVSPLVTARRAQDLGFISKDQFFTFYNHYLGEEKRRTEGREGGNFWNTQNVRIGSRFGSSVVRAAKEGKLLYSEAYQLTGLKGNVFETYAEKLGFR